MLTFLYRPRLVCSSFLYVRSAWRDCMKKGRRMVFRYSSRYEKTLPDRPFRCRVELHRASHARSQATRTTQDPQPARDPRRHPLRPKEWLPVAPTASRLPQMAHRLLFLQSLAHRRYLGADQPGYPRTSEGSLETKPSAQRSHSGFPVGQEYRSGWRRVWLGRRQEGQGP
jgi:hypothetical protein